MNLDTLIPNERGSGLSIASLRWLAGKLNRNRKAQMLRSLSENEVRPDLGAIIALAQPKTETARKEGEVTVFRR